MIRALAFIALFSQCNCAGGEPQGQAQEREYLQEQADICAADGGTPEYSFREFRKPKSIAVNCTVDRREASNP